MCSNFAETWVKFLELFFPVCWILWIPNTLPWLSYSVSMDTVILIWISINFGCKVVLSRFLSARATVFYKHYIASKRASPFRILRVTLVGCFVHAVVCLVITPCQLSNSWYTCLSAGSSIFTFCRTIIRIEPHVHVGTSGVTVPEKS